MKKLIPFIIKVPRLHGNYMGLTIWPFIFMVNPDDKGLLAHEMVHIRQQQEGWLIGFYIKYFYYQWKYGYEKNPYEVEAREISGSH